MPRNTDKLNLLINATFESIKGLVSLSEKELYALLEDVLKEFVVKGGKLISDASDFITIQAIADKVNKSLVKSGYPKYIDNFIPVIGDIEDETKLLIKSFNPRLKFSKEVVNMSQDKKLAIDTLVKALNAPESIRVNISAPIQQIIANAVQNNATFDDATRILKEYIVGDSERGGRLSQYYKQIATDSLNQWQGTVNARVSAQYGLIDFNYVGGTKTTSRPQCRRWLHKSYTYLGVSRKGYGGLLVREVLEDQMRKAQKTVGKSTVEFSGYSSFAYPTIESFPIIRGGHNCDDFAIATLATVEEAQAAIDLYNSIEGTKLIQTYEAERDF